MLSFKEYVLLTEEYTKHPSTQYGSNPGGLHTHIPSGERFYIKFPHNPEQAHVEVATADLYRHMGVKTLDPKIVMIDGKTGVATKWNEYVSPVGYAAALHAEMDNADNAAHLARMHHAAVVTGNLDIVGLEYDNILKHKHTGDLLSVDQGGAMHFRAMGEKKEFGNSIDREVSGFMNPAYQSGRVFSKLPPETLKAAAQHLNALTDEKIDDVMSRHGLSKLASTVKARRDALKSIYD